MIGAEFVGMILLIVYVGAVAVLFLFVVMMLEGNFVKVKQGFLQYMPFGFFIALVIFFELIIIIGSWQYRPEFIKTAKIAYDANDTNTVQIGKLLYTDYFLPFQLSGIVLLVAMIGAILLTFRRRDNLKRQDILKQSSREREDSIELVDVESNKGVKVYGRFLCLFTKYNRADFYSFYFNCCSSRSCNWSCYTCGFLQKQRIYPS